LKGNLLRAEKETSDKIEECSRKRSRPRKGRWERDDQKNAERRERTPKKPEGPDIARVEESKTSKGKLLKTQGA